MRFSFGLFLWYAAPGRLGIERLSGHNALLQHHLKRLSTLVAQPETLNPWVGTWILTRSRTI
jgi:hypothetical protein